MSAGSGLIPLGMKGNPDEGEIVSQHYLNGNYAQIKIIKHATFSSFPPACLPLNYERHC